MTVSAPLVMRVVVDEAGRSVRLGLRMKEEIDGVVTCTWFLGN